MIPKIIHHMAPTDVRKWHPIWSRCLDSWKKCFPESEYEHIMWNDEDIDNLIKEKYSQYWSLYQSFEYHIIKLDFARHAILHLHGGIYVDMDMFCYKNFYNELDSDTVTLESFVPDEILQNSMLITNKENQFMIYCMDECVRNFYPNDKRLSMDHYVKDICGPYHLTRCYKKYPKKIKLLDASRFNPVLDKYNESFVTKHMITGLWGKDAFDTYNQKIKPNNPNASYYDTIKGLYKKKRNIDVDDYDFYKNY